MFDRLPTVTAVFAVLAAAIHLYIFALESLLFRRRFAWRTFGLRSQQDAETIRLWALNQGFYNLFLAIGAIVGVLLTFSDDAVVIGAGTGMVVLSTGSMVAAAVVLLAARPTLLRAAAVQGLAPLIALLALVLG
jgi:putative membrane protein